VPFKLITSTTFFVLFVEIVTVACTRVAVATRGYVPRILAGVLVRDAMTSSVGCVTKDQEIRFHALTGLGFLNLVVIVRVRRTSHATFAILCRPPG
jgi:hypothetical protein